MRATFRRGTPADTSADTLVVLLFDGESAPADLDSALGGRLGKLLESGEAKTANKRTALLHTDGAIAAARVITVGLGKREDFDSERARNAAAVAYRQAADASAQAIAIAVPEGTGQATTGAALTEGVLLAAYRFDRYKTKADDDDSQRAEQLEIVSNEDIGQAIAESEIIVACQNAARDLQNLPSNVLTPAELADYAIGRAGEVEALEAEVLELEQLEARQMGGLLSVAKGSHQQPKLIVLRYDGGGTATLGLVGKAVTFDTGGISIKPSSKMEEMKFDMSGGAAAIEATVAIAKLGLPVKLLTVVPAAENMPSGHATRPGDIVTISNGKTVEINNTDAEGRMILADALVYAASEGADRIIDLATLTGAIIVALGSTYAGLFSNDDDLSAAIAAAGDSTGELTWRMPLHADFKELTKGKFADLTNAASARKASSAYAASFLEEFVDEKPWAHLDIAGTAWSQDGRDYVGNGATGWGVRLLVELARGMSA
ncbi:MAG: leucyl aminopeptidase [Solirubrobacterales bacterium]